MTTIDPGPAARISVRPIPGFRNLQLALVGLGLLAVASATLDPDPLRRGVVVLLAAAGIVAAVFQAWRLLARELEALTAAAARISAGDYDAPIPHAGRPQTAALATSLEHARATLVARMHALEQQRDGLAEYLTRAEQRLREPVADARRERLARLEGVAVTLVVGPDRTAATLVDLTLDQGVFALAPEVARRLVPGMPLAIRITLGDQVIAPKGAFAIAPTHTDGSGLVEWVVRFPEALARSSVPTALWQAVAMRGAERVKPPPGIPATATLLAPFGDVPAQVTDLSETGVGLLVSLDATRLGDLDRALVARLTFPTLGRMAVLSAELCNVTPAPVGVRLGLRFTGDERAERARLAEWLAACAAQAPPIS